MVKNMKIKEVFPCWEEKIFKTDGVSVINVVKHVSDTTWAVVFECDYKISEEVKQIIGENFIVESDIQYSIADK